MQKQPTPALGQTRITLIEAIARKQTVVARYNGAACKLAPHLIFERHGDLHLCALNLSKAVRTPDERQLGQFKLAGLSDAELLDEPFDPLPDFDGAPPRTEDLAIFAIQKAGA